MSIIGLDIGTTTLSAVVRDEKTGLLIDRRTVPHGAFLPGLPFERIQDVSLIESLAMKLMEELSCLHGPLSAVGLTGQMHGVLYVDNEGEAVSPLYTWQDGRGDLPLEDGRSLAAALSEETGYPLASGFGCVTHASLLRSSRLPPRAACLSTIHAYIAMKLAGKKRPLLHASDAASLGLYDLSARRFDRTALAALRPEFFPETTPTACMLGETPSGAKVVSAIGDNQASFLGAMAGQDGGVLVNIGTGSQVSMKTGRLLTCPNCETRPLDGDEHLLVGAPLCGGRAYALLEKFLRECASLAGVPAGSLYERMNALALTAPEHPLTADARFCGTRANPALRGSITGLGEDNFTPHHFIHAVLTGMAEELHGYYLSMSSASGRPAETLVASGNAVRMNPALQKILSEVFGMELRVPAVLEEAAAGAAGLAGRTAGIL
ncbi:MAG: hypothetical protein IJE08_03770 [Clostridia bacterium]|nr:hypothetical protein [Clostridia bacterium]